MDTAKKSHSKYLFTSDYYGYLIKWNISKQQILKNYGRLLDGGFRPMKITQDSKYLLTTDIFSNLIQWNIPEHKLVKNYGDFSKGTIITSMALTKNQQYLFIADEYGYLFQ